MKASALVLAALSSGSVEAVHHHTRLHHTKGIGKQSHANDVFKYDPTFYDTVPGYYETLINAHDSAYYGSHAQTESRDVFKYDPTFYDTVPGYYETLINAHDSAYYGSHAQVSNQHGHHHKQHHRHRNHHREIPEKLGDKNSATKEASWKEYEARRPEMHDCLLDESKNWFGNHRCKEEWECQGARVCEFMSYGNEGTSGIGWCRGPSACPLVAPSHSHSPTSSN